MTNHEEKVKESEKKKKNATISFNRVTSYHCGSWLQGA